MHFKGRGLDLGRADLLPGGGKRQSIPEKIKASIALWQNVGDKGLNRFHGAIPRAACFPVPE